MKETVAALAHKDVTGDNRKVDMVTRDMGDSKADGDSMKNMVNSVDTDNRDMEEVNRVDLDRDTEVSKVEEVNRVDRDMEVSRADGDSRKGMVNNVDMDNRSTADLDSNMKASMVREVMAGVAMMKMKMNPACRDVTGVGKKNMMKKILMKTMMKMMTSMVCKASMEKRKKSIMMKTKMKRMKTTTGRCRAGRAVALDPITDHQVLLLAVTAKAAEAVPEAVRVEVVPAEAVPERDGAR